MDWVNIIWAGLVATGAMTAVMYLGILEAASRQVPALLRARGRGGFSPAAVTAGTPQVDVVGMMGRVVSQESRQALAVGLALHVAMGVAAAVVYGLVWRLANTPGTWWTGLGLGLVHGLAVAVALPAATRALEEWRPGRVGVFLHGGPTTLWVVIAAHAAFGLVLGLLYNP